MGDHYVIGVIAAYHEQPPFETPARVWTESRSFPDHATLRDVRAWTHRDARYAHACSSVVLTWELIREEAPDAE